MKNISAFLYAFCLIFLFSASVTAENEILQTQPNTVDYELTLERNEAGDTLIRVTGDIARGFDSVFLSFMKASPDISFIEFNSRGGFINEIQRSGKHIRENKIPIVINAGEVCASTCGYLALFSPNITINGLIAFHLPYLSVYANTATLYDISQSNVRQTLFTARDMFRNGWLLILHYLIASETGLDLFLVFDTEIELNKFRFTDPVDYSKSNIDDVQYYILTGARMARKSFIQRYNNQPE